MKNDISFEIDENQNVVMIQRTTMTLEQFLLYTSQTTDFAKSMQPGAQIENAKTKLIQHDDN